MSVRSRPRGVGGPHRAAPRSVGGLDGRGWDPGTSLSPSNRASPSSSSLPMRAARPPTERGQVVRTMVHIESSSSAALIAIPVRIWGWANPRGPAPDRPTGVRRRRSSPPREPATPPRLQGRTRDGGEGEQDPEERPERHEVEDARVPGPEKIGEPRGEQQRARQPAQSAPGAPPWAAHHSHKAPASVGTTASSGQRGGAIGPGFSRSCRFRLRARSGSR